MIGDKPEPGEQDSGEPAPQLPLTSAALEARVAGLTRALAEAREQQTATSEVLRVIASAPTELQRALDTIADSAARLCDASNAAIFQVEGSLLRMTAQRGPNPGSPVGLLAELTPAGLAGRAVLERRTIHVRDISSEEGDEFPGVRALAAPPDDPRSGPPGLTGERVSRQLATGNADRHPKPSRGSAAARR